MATEMKISFFVAKIFVFISNLFLWFGLCVAGVSDIFIGKSADNSYLVCGYKTKSGDLIIVFNKRLTQKFRDDLRRGIL